MENPFQQLNQRLDQIEKTMQEFKVFNSPALINPVEDYVGIEEASKILRLKRATIYTLTSQNKIPFFKQGKYLFFTRQSLLDWLKAGRKKTIEEIQEEASLFVAKKNKNFTK